MADDEMFTMDDLAILEDLAKIWQQVPPTKARWFRLPSGDYGIRDHGR